MRRCVPAPLLLLLSGCQGWQSALDPKGPEARGLSHLIWLFTGIMSAVWLAVMVALVVALVRSYRARTVDPADPLTTDAVADHRYTRVVTGLTFATGLIVIALSVLSYFGQARLYGIKGEGMHIHIIGHQWWWEVRYEDPRADHTLTTANEFHIPVGVPVTLTLTSPDVNHSFWVPSLMGKQDLIAGKWNTLTFTADRPGTYRGQCAEFCGLQHAHMSMLIVAEPKEAFDAWQAAQLKPADPPQDPERKKGLEFFLSKPCVMCHMVRGTPAGGQVAPDLTHVGSRQYIAAGTLPRSRGSFAAWIVDPHSTKPGVNMPLIKLEPDEVNAISAFLEGLK